MCSDEHDSGLGTEPLDLVVPKQQLFEALLVRRVVTQRHTLRARVCVCVGERGLKSHGETHSYQLNVCADGGKKQC